MSVTASPLLFRNLSRSDDGRPPSLGPAPPESSMSSEEEPEEEQTERLLRGRSPEMAGPRSDEGRRERSFGGRGSLAAAAAVAAEERASSMSAISSSVTISIGIAGGGRFERWSPPAPPINCLRFNRRAKRLFVSTFVHEWFWKLRQWLTVSINVRRIWSRIRLNKYTNRDEYDSDTNICIPSKFKHQKSNSKIISFLFIILYRNMQIQIWSDRLK